MPFGGKPAISAVERRRRASQGAAVADSIRQKRYREARNPRCASQPASPRPGRFPQRRTAKLQAGGHFYDADSAAMCRHARGAVAPGDNFPDARQHAQSAPHASHIAVWASLRMPGKRSRSNANFLASSVRLPFGPYSKSTPIAGKVLWQVEVLRCAFTPYVEVF